MIVRACCSKHNTSLKWNLGPGRAFQIPILHTPPDWELGRANVPSVQMPAMEELRIASSALHHRVIQKPDPHISDL